MNWIHKIVNFFSKRGMSDIERAAHLMVVAVPIVEMVARMTPTRSDDELIDLFKSYAIPGVEAWLAVPPESRGRALMTVAATALKRITPDKIDRIIDLAVQLAVVEAKAK